MLITLSDRRSMLQPGTVQSIFHAELSGKLSQSQLKLRVLYSAGLEEHRRGRCVQCREGGTEVRAVGLQGGRVADCCCTAGYELRRTRYSYEYDGTLGTTLGTTVELGTTVRYDGYEYDGTLRYILYLVRFCSPKPCNKVRRYEQQSCSSSCSSWYEYGSRDFADDDDDDAMMMADELDSIFGKIAKPGPPRH